MDLGDFLIGFFSLAREAAQRDSRLLDRLNDLIMGLNEEQFWEVLPGLRLAFTFFTPREKHNLIDMLFPQGRAGEDEDALAGMPPIDMVTFEHAELLAERVLETIQRFGLRHPRPAPTLESQAAEDFAQQPQPPQSSPQQPSGEDEGGEDELELLSHADPALGASSNPSQSQPEGVSATEGQPEQAQDGTESGGSEPGDDITAQDGAMVPGQGAAQAAPATQSASGAGGVSGRGAAATGPTQAGGEQHEQAVVYPVEERMQRWKMVLGVGGEDLPASLPESWQQREQLVSFLYDREYGRGRNIRGAGGGSGQGQASPGGSRQGGSGESQLTVPDWINGIHELFPQRVIERLEKDALDRYNIEELVTRPEMLAKAEPNITLMKAVLRTKHLMDEEVLKLARNLVRKVVTELVEKLAREVQTPFTGAIDRRRRSFLKIAKNFSADETIRRNLKHYDPETGKIIIQDPFFYSRIKRQVDRWQIIIVVDQSGSMVDSVIHSAITASIFWGIKAIKTHLVVFDTEIVDLTSDCQDPVDTLMKVQLGGGTEIGKALRYAQTLIENPTRTIMLLVTDFYEGGPIQELFAVTKSICEGGTKLLGLAALDGNADPSYDRDTAQRMVNLGAEVGAMTPGELAAWVAEKVR